MATLSTHVLDTSLGRPAAGIRVTLDSDSGVPLGEGVTDADGRVGTLGGDLAEGTYRIRFGVDGLFYPEVVVAFRVTADDHYHVPLLLSPYGYSTYRGS